MRLKRLALKNIRSYEEQEIIFPDGSLLLMGDIGSGKSSILLAIEYAFFGLQPGQSGAALLRTSSHEGEVLLELEASGNNIIIERHLKRGAKSITNEYSALTVNGEKIEYSVTELKMRILQVLNYPQEFLKRNNLLYRYTVYTPQEQMKQIILEDFQSRLNVLRYIFGIEKYRRMQENNLLLSGMLKEEIKMLQGEIKSLEDEKQKRIKLLSLNETLKYDIKIIESVVQNFHNQRKAIEGDMRELEEKIREREKLEIELEKTKVILNSKLEQSILIRKEIIGYEKNIKENEFSISEEDVKYINQEIKKHKSLIEKLNERFIQINTQRISIQEKKDEHIEKKERFFALNICPTCLQNVGTEHKHNILNSTEQTLKVLENQQSTLIEESAIILPQIENAKNSLIIMEKKNSEIEAQQANSAYIKKAKQKLEELRNIQASFEQDNILLNKHLDMLKSDILKSSVIVNKWKSKQKELQNAQEQEKQAEIRLAELNKENTLRLQELKLLEDTIAQKELTQKKLLYIVELNYWLAQKCTALIIMMENHRMMSLRQEFSKLFSKWFHMLAGYALSAQLDENFTPLILQQENELDYAFLSGGERTAIALAYRLALNQTVNSVWSTLKTQDLVILDEPTDGFSDTQLDKIRDVLHELKIQQLIIVSHERKIESFVDHVLKLRKEGDISRIEPQQISVRNI